jgi:hypothetical protein
MTSILTSAEQATPEWLTNVLQREGVLGVGAVRSIEKRIVEWNSATLAYLQVSYTPGSTTSAPTRLFLKIPKSIDWALESCRDEVKFYQTVGASQAELPFIIRCYDATYSEESGISNLLLEDLSNTHFTPVTREQALEGGAIPSWPQLESMVDCVAKFHAHWWEHPGLGEGIAQVYNLFRSRDAYQGYIERRERELAAFLSTNGERLPGDWVELYEQAVAKLPDMWDRCLEERLLGRKQVTLTHGDCYFAQFLCPTSVTGQTFLGDWQSTSTYLPGDDLVHMFGIFWTPGQRRQDNREERLLRRYHEGLQANGVMNYSWEQLRHDYRFSIIDALFLTIWDQTNGSSEAYWVPKLERVTANYIDLDCADLLLY